MALGQELGLLLFTTPHATHLPHATRHMPHTTTPTMTAASSPGSNSPAPSPSITLITLPFSLRHQSCANFQFSSSILWFDNPAVYQTHNHYEPCLLHYSMIKLASSQRGFSHRLWLTWTNHRYKQTEKEREVERGKRRGRGKGRGSTHQVLHLQTVCRALFIDCLRKCKLNK